MKIAKNQPGIFSVLCFNAKQVSNVLILAAIITCSFNNIYGNDELSKNGSSSLSNFNPDITADIDRITLTGYADAKSDYLQWEVFNPSIIKSFTIECSKGNDMNFIDVVTVKPLECNDISKNTLFTYNCSNYDEQGSAYYKIKATYEDNSTIESNFIYIKRAEIVSDFKISQIRNDAGLVTLTYKSPKDQSITLNILNKSGQLLIAKEIEAAEGDNTYIYDASFLPSSEMLIFLLNNQEELITKKYILASAG